MRRLLAVTVLVPALALSACGAGAKSKSQESLKPLDIVRLAGATTTEAGTAKMAMSFSAAGFTMTGEGVTSLEETKGSMTMTMGIGEESLAMEMRMIGEIIYFKLPEGAMEADGKPWVSLDLDALSKKAGFDIAKLQQFKSTDPTASLAYFEGVSDSVKEIGKEDVRGEPTTKYEVIFDINKALGEADDPEAKQALKDATAKLGVNNIPATVWIDDEGRMRKMLQTIDLSKVAGAEGGAGALTTTFELYDFGTDLDVKPPPADQVGDGTALLAG